LALKNLGVIFSQEGDNLLALHYLRCFYKTDAMDLQICAIRLRLGQRAGPEALSYVARDAGILGSALHALARHDHLPDNVGLYHLYDGPKYSTTTVFGQSATHALTISWLCILSSVIRTPSLT
jgi:hypothetical protein